MIPANLAPAGTVACFVAAGRAVTSAVWESGLTEVAKAPAVIVVSVCVTLTEAGRVMLGVERGERGPSGGRGLAVKQAGQVQ